MIEIFTVGALVGATMMGIFSQWSHRKEIEYKAETGIDMCLGGVFYTVTINKERMKNQ